MIGIDGNWVQDAMKGAAYGIGMIVVGFLIPAISIVYPNVIGAMSWSDKVVVVVVLAPIIEELFFRGAALSLLQKEFGTGFWLGNVVQSAMFASYHWLVYGKGLMMAFFGAGIFGLLAGFVTRQENSVMTAIVMHAVFNAFILFSGMAVIGI